MTVRFEKHGNVGEIVFTDPPMNLFSFERFADLGRVLEQAEKARLRALVVRAEGHHFSAGADARSFQGLGVERARAAVADGMSTLKRLERLTIPTLAVTHGLCLAPGIEIAMACDFIWSAEDAQFGFVDVSIGGFPFVGGAQRLAARAGAVRAKEAVFGGALYPAATMLDWGVLSRVLSPSELVDKSSRYAQRLAAGPTRALGAAKHLIALSVEEGLEAADAATPGLAGEVIASEDLQGGVASYLAHGPDKATFANR